MNPLKSHLAFLIVAVFSLFNPGCLAKESALQDSGNIIESGLVGDLAGINQTADIFVMDKGGPIVDALKPPAPKDGGKKPPVVDAGKTKPLKDWGTSDAGVLANQCLNNTKTEGECKDCCDCIGLSCTDMAPCRDACPTHDFTKNQNFITVTVKSTLGPNGDYSTCTALGTQQPCKECCECKANLECGDTRFCRDQCNKLPTQ